MSAPPRHSRKLEIRVLDQAPHIPKPLVWHVIECSCGWSSALHRFKDDARTAYDQHRARENRKKKPKGVTS